MEQRWAQKIAALAVPLVMFFSLAAPAYAAGGMVQIVQCGNDGQNPCTVCDLATLAQNILNDAIYLSVFLSAILFAWAGFKMLTSSANPEGRNAGKTIFFNVTIGLVIILAAWLVVDILMRTLVGTSILPWNTLC